MAKDLGSRPEIVNLMEVGATVQETERALANLETWMAPEHKSVPATVQPATGTSPRLTACETVYPARLKPLPLPAANAPCCVYAGYIVKEPYGIALIMGAWNYPVRLLLFPVYCASVTHSAIVSGRLTDRPRRGSLYTSSARGRSGGGQCRPAQAV